MPVLSMDDLARLFYTSGVLLGAPCLAMLGLCGIHRLTLAATRTHATAARLENPDAMLLLLDGMIRVLAVAARVIGALGRVLAGALAVVSGLGLLLAVALWLTGKGLSAQSEWARFSAGAFALVGLGIAVALVLKGGLFGRLGGLLGAATSLLVLHALWVV